MTEHLTIFDNGDILLNTSPLKALLADVADQDEANRVFRQFFMEQGRAAVAEMDALGRPEYVTAEAWDHYRALFANQANDMEEELRNG